MFCYIDYVKIYTGIGSRKTPKNILNLMTNIAKKLDNQGWILRSGGAFGADTAFENGSSNKQIFTPENFDKRHTPFCLQKLIPVLDKNRDFDNFKYMTRLLLYRNVHQILGVPPNIQLSKFVIFWIPTLDIWSEHAGGTKYAIRIAQQHNIPIFNLYDEKTKLRLEKWLIE